MPSLRSSSASARPSLRLGTHLRRSFGAVITLVLLVVVVASTGYLLSALRYEPQLRSAVVATRAVRSFHQGMQDQQSGIRGQLLSRDAKAGSVLLAPYRDGVRAYAHYFATVRALIGDDQRLGRLLKVSDEQAQIWMSRWATAALAAPNTDPWLRSSTFLNRGEQLFRSYRDAEAELQAAMFSWVDHLLAVQRRTSAESAAVALGGGLVVTLAVERQRRRLNGLVVTPVNELAEAVRRVRDGDLEATVTSSGPWELRGLAEGFTQMTAALRDDREELRGRELSLVEQRNRGRTLLMLTRRLSESLDQSDIVESAVAGAASYTDSQDATLWLALAHSDVLAAAHRVGASRDDPREILEPDQSVVHRAAELGQLVEEVTDGEDGASRRRIALPLLAGERKIGVLEVGRASPEPLPPDVLDGLRIFGTAVVSALEVARLHQQSLELSQRDPLTGLLNRRRLDEDLPREVALALRYDAPLSFLMIDIDHFKQLNDRAGHLVGDAVLRELSEELTAAVRGTDLCYRFGGEEFCVLLRNTDQPAAQALADRLRKRTGRRLATRSVTISIGVSAVPRSARDGMELIRRADAALYEAKRAGRNRVRQSRPLAGAGAGPAG